MWIRQRSASSVDACITVPEFAQCISGIRSPCRDWAPSSSWSTHLFAHLTSKAICTSMRNIIIAIILLVVFGGSRALIPTSGSASLTCDALFASTHPSSSHDGDTSKLAANASSPTVFDISCANKGVVPHGASCVLVVGFSPAITATCASQLSMLRLQVRVQPPRSLALYEHSIIDVEFVTKTCMRRTGAAVSVERRRASRSATCMASQAFERLYYLLREALLYIVMLYL
jgi:hypothetical protein